MATRKTRYTGAIIHPLSAILVIVLDIVWTVPEGGAASSVIGLVTVPVLIAILAAICFIGVFLVQKFTANDSTGSAAAKAFVMSIIAAIPFPVSGTAVGSLLLLWAGVSAVQKFLPRLPGSK